MPIALSPNTSEVYICKEDKTLPPEQQTRFQVKIMSFRQLAELQKTMEQLDGEDISLEAYADAIERGLALILKGWTNFKDEDGNEIKFTEQLANKFPALSARLSQELIRAGFQVNRLTEEEAGNSK